MTQVADFKIIKWICRKCGEKTGEVFILLDKYVCRKCYEEKTI